MGAFQTAWLAHQPAPIPVLGPLMRAWYLNYLRRPLPHGPGPDMGKKIAYLVRRNLIRDAAGLIRRHAKTLHNYRTIRYAVLRGNNRYLPKCIEVALADLDVNIPIDELVDNND
jgi:hypothetical protein